MTNNEYFDVSDLWRLRTAQRFILDTSDTSVPEKDRRDLSNGLEARIRALVVRVNRSIDEPKQSGGADQ